MDELGDAICTRDLTAVVDGRTVDVRIAIGRPNIANDGSGDFDCEYLVTHRFNPIRGTYRATDSMQALSGTFMAIQHTLSKNLEDVRWLGLPYEEFELYVVVSDAARRRAIASIVADEEHALGENVRRHEELRRRLRAETQE